MSVASDMEAIAFERVAAALGDFDPIFLTDAYVREPPEFPALQLVLSDCPVDPALRDSGGVGNGYVAKFEANAYADAASGGKRAVSKIADAVCSEFERMGFECKLRQPVPNGDPSVRRVLMRFQAGVTNGMNVYKI